MLWDDPGNGPAVQYNGAVIDLAVHGHGHSDHRRDLKLPGQCGKLLCGAPAVIQKRLLEKQGLTGISRQTQFREHRNGSPLLRRFSHLVADFYCVSSHIRHGNVRYTTGYPDIIKHSNHPFDGIILFYYGDKNPSRKGPPAGGPF